MGVPKFFRWAADRYPAILSDVISAKNPLPPIDMLFFDMNGIIHHCSHKDEAVTKEWSMDEVVSKVQLTLLQIVEEIVKPQVLIYFAIDGVAPRAKLNQQRARRYRAAKELEKETEGSVASETAFDSNCITPGTDFMRQISERLLQFIARQKETSPYWNSLNIVFSGSEVPGEGEHKIISYIREMKEQHLLAPNNRYCLYGADADMIMLSLATHEPYTVVLREINQIDATKRPGQGGHDAHAHVHAQPEITHGAERVKENDVHNINIYKVEESEQAKEVRKPMQFIRMNVLREYLWNEFSTDMQLNARQPGEEELQWGDEEEVEAEQKVEVQGGGGGGGAVVTQSHSHAGEVVLDLERLIDDFVFLTFLVGNDFLPHLPGLDINDNAFDILFDAYKTIFSTHHAYLVHNGKVDYARLELLCAIVGATQIAVYEERQANDRRKGRRERGERGGFKGLGEGDGDQQTENEGEEGEEVEEDGEYEEEEESDTAALPSPPPPHNHKEEKGGKGGGHHNHSNHSNQSDHIDHSGHQGGAGHTSQHQQHHNREGSTSSTSSSEQHLSSREKYYLSKFGFHPDHTHAHTNAHTHTAHTAPNGLLLGEGQSVSLRVVVREYLQGLEWCLAYYSRGCISWDWFYPFHYGLFLSDMTSLAAPDVAGEISFHLAQPLLPFQQLLACLPPQSVRLLPPALHHLVIDATSPLIAYYPRDFDIDMNGKKREYEAVVLLPFIDIHLLTSASSLCWELLTAEETRRNGFGKVHYFMPYEAQEQLFDFKIAPSDCFRSALIPGTSDRVEGFPSVLEVRSVGRPFYFIRGGGNGRGRGRGGGRGRGRGRGGGGGGGR